MNIHEGILNMAFDEEPDLRFHSGREVARVLSEDDAFSAPGREKSVDDIDGGGFTGTILSQQSEDTASSDIEAEVFVHQLFPIIMGEVFTFYNILHNDT